MNYYILAIEAVVLVIIFTFMIIVPLCKNPVWWIHDYPKDIQEEYFKTHERIPAAPLSKPTLVKKGFAVLLAIVILTLGVWLVGARTFKEGFVISYLLWQIGNWYDCFFLGAFGPFLLSFGTALGFADSSDAGFDAFTFGSRVVAVLAVSFSEVLFFLESGVISSPRTYGLLFHLYHI